MQEFIHHSDSNTAEMIKKHRNVSHSGKGLKQNFAAIDCSIIVKKLCIVFSEWQPKDTTVRFTTSDEIARDVRISKTEIVLWEPCLAIY